MDNLGHIVRNNAGVKMFVMAGLCLLVALMIGSGLRGPSPSSSVDINQPALLNKAGAAVAKNAPTPASSNVSALDVALRSMSNKAAATSNQAGENTAASNDKKVVANPADTNQVASGEVARASNGSPANPTATPKSR